MSAHESAIIATEIRSTERAHNSRERSDVNWWQANSASVAVALCRWRSGLMLSMWWRAQDASVQLAARTTEFSRVRKAVRWRSASDGGVECASFTAKYSSARAVAENVCVHEWPKLLVLVPFKSTLRGRRRSVGPKANNRKACARRWWDCGMVTLWPRTF